MFSVFLLLSTFLVSEFHSRASIQGKRVGFMTEILAMLASVCLQEDVGREVRFWGRGRETARFSGTGATHGVAIFPGAGAW
jgi:hypothetical protein